LDIGLQGDSPAALQSENALLSIRDLQKTFLRGRFPFQSRQKVHALNGVNLSIDVPGCVSLVGASGSGKSTLAHCIARLIEPDSGEIRFCGSDLFALDRRLLFLARRKIQLVLQQSAASLNPAFSVLDILMEPLRIQGIGSPTERRERALAMMNRLDLPGTAASRSPVQLSGGQRQRLALARALILEPSLLILDEALSGLDLPLQDHLGNLLLDLSRSTALSLLLITHDLRLAAKLSDRIEVMHAGTIIESGKTQDVLSRPAHPYTSKLLAAVPGVALRFHRESATGAG
jgi:peptide/nickel transport system ATP-binding protein